MCEQFEAKICFEQKCILPRAYFKLCFFWIYLWWIFLFNVPNLSLGFKGSLFFLIQAEGSVWGWELMPAAIPATSPMLRRSMSDRAPCHVPLSVAALFCELSPPPGSTSSVETQGSYQPQRQPGDLKVQNLCPVGLGLRRRVWISGRCKTSWASAEHGNGAWWHLLPPPTETPGHW